MSATRVRDQHGGLLIDAPSNLSGGTALDLVVDDPGDELGDEESAALDAAISRAWSAVNAGQVRPAGEVLKALCAR